MSLEVGGLDEGQSELGCGWDGRGDSPVGHCVHRRAEGG